MTATRDQQNNSSSSWWRLSLRHVCVTIITSFLFGYHVGVVNEPLENIAMDLGFSGSTMAEGSMCLGGAFIDCMFSGWIADGIGRRRAYLLSAVSMIVGPCLSATSTSLGGMLGRFLVGIGMGVSPPVASLYVTEVSPPSVRGTFGSFIQIAMSWNLRGSLLWNPCQGSRGMVACVLLGICYSCSSACLRHGIFHGKSSLAI